MNGEKQEMPISIRGVIQSLGGDLYGNLPAFLCELIANAWDADAEEVIVTIGGNDEGTLTIEDDGNGMDGDGLKKYVEIAAMRTEGNKSPLGRSLMGRKGVGKLVIFGLSDSFELHTKKEGSQPVAIRASEGSYFSIKPVKGGEKGTRIILQLRQDYGMPSLEEISKGIARRIRRIGCDFRVTLKDERSGKSKAVALKDGMPYDKVQFLWKIGEGGLLPGEEEYFSAVEHKRIFDSTYDKAFSLFYQKYKFSGWLGTVHKPSDLKDGKEKWEHSNKIVVFANGKMCQEDILSKMITYQHFATGLTGVIEADFLDAGEVDAIQTNRQGIKEDTPEHKVLYGFVEQRVNEIRREYDGLRKGQPPKQQSKKKTDQEEETRKELSAPFEGRDKYRRLMRRGEYHLIFFEMYKEYLSSIEKRLGRKAGKDTYGLFCEAFGTREIGIQGWREKW